MSVAQELRYSIGCLLENTVEFLFSGSRTLMLSDPLRKALKAFSKR